MGLSSEMKNGINVVPFETVHDLGRIRNVSMIKGKVSLIIESTGIVQGRAVFQLVERNNVVGIWVCDGQVSHQPAGTVFITALVKTPRNVASPIYDRTE